MSEQPPTEDPSNAKDATEPEWRRRRRLAAVFGDVLPEQTSEDRDPAGSQQGLGDDWYQDQVPPHHG